VFKKVDKLDAKNEQKNPQEIDQEKMRKTSRKILRKVIKKSGRLFPIVSHRFPQLSKAFQSR